MLWLITVLYLWFPSQKIPCWLILLVIAIVAGLIFHQLTYVALVPILLLTAVIYAAENSQAVPLYIKHLAFILTLILASGLACHLFPGFNNIQVINQIQLSPHALPYRLTLSIDKAIVGILILGMTTRRIATFLAWQKLLKSMAPSALIIVTGITCIALILGFVVFDPKLPYFWKQWVLINLLITCVAEEALFRGILQRKLYPVGTIPAIFISALVFGLSHYPGGVKYMLLACVAGVAYGWAYYKWQRLEASILLHFSVNLTHFLLLTYPALMTVVN